MSETTSTPTPTNEQQDVRERVRHTDDFDACPVCSPPVRETVGMVCQGCGTDYAKDDARTIAWNTWIDDVGRHMGSRTRDLMSAFDAGWAARDVQPTPLATVSAAAPDERALGVAADLIDWLADARDEYASAGGPYADAIHQETALARTLAKALRNPEDAWGWLPTWMAPEYEARHAAALAARPAPTVNAADVEITTAAELDALPAGTIVRDRFGGYLAQGRDAMGVAWFHYPVYDHAGSSALVAGIGPVTVCFTPGLTVADEGRAEDRIDREGGEE